MWLLVWWLLRSWGRGSRGRYGALPLLYARDCQPLWGGIQAQEERGGQSRASPQQSKVWPVPSTTAAPRPKCLEPVILLVSRTEIAVLCSGKARAENKYHQSLDPVLVLPHGCSGAGVSRQIKQKRKREEIEEKRARERRRKPIPPSFIVHLLHATWLFTLSCLHMHSSSSLRGE